MSTPIRHYLKSFWLLAVAFILIVGCDSDTTEPADDGDLTHATKITADETWCDDRLHIIDGDIVVENATLTICDGATVQFTENSRLIIGDNGALVTGADVADPKGVMITGSSPVPGYWNMLEIRSSARTGATFCYNTTFAYGGNLTSMVRVGVDAVFKGCSFTNSANSGVYVENSALPQFTDCVFENCGEEPIRTTIANAHSIKAGNTFTGNGKQYVLVEQGSLQRDALWMDLTVPYRVQGNANTIQTGTLTIAPGTEVQMDEAARIIIEKQAGLIADGTVEPILFTGATTLAGSWSSLEFRDDADHNACVLNNCTIEYGGASGNNAMVVGYGASFRMEQCTLRNSSGAGLYLNGAAQPTLNDNVITGCGTVPVDAYFQNIGRLNGGSYTGNASDFLQVRGGTITSATTFNRHDVPYRMIDDVNKTEALLTIASGAQLEFEDGRLLIDDGGAVVAIGRPLTITFSGASKIPGSWRYIEIRTEANSGACIFDKCKVEFSGSSRGAFFLGSNTTPTIKNCEITFSGSCGVFMGLNANPEMTGNVFSNNAGQDVCE